jgi:hypothetical protein
VPYQLSQAHHSLKYNIPFHYSLHRFIRHRFGLVQIRNALPNNSIPQLMPLASEPLH